MDFHTLIVPEGDAHAALELAASRGVQRRLLAPEKADNRLQWLAVMAYFDEHRDIEVWGYENGFMQQKVILVDDEISGVGTTNFDNRSFCLNFEALAVLFDKQFADEVATMQEADFENSFLLTRSLPECTGRTRIAAPVARLSSSLWTVA